jgi:Carboxypeptidase regulatory-like domain/TonB dependent receptor/TonB-dependent Receptor Plug Domain
VRLSRAFLLRLFALNILIVTTLTIAQSTNGIMSGMVLDPGSNVIAAADIVVVNDATGVRYPGSTNNEGIYSITNLPPGEYRIQVSKIGFKTIIKPDITLHIQDVLSINFTLPVGAFSETLTVEGGTPAIDTESAAVSTVIDRQFVENLPLNGRSFNTLLQLTPGVVIAQQPKGSATAPGQFSISGQRTDANSFTVDGVSANFGVATNGLYSGQSGTGSAQAFSALGGTSSLVSVEALQEFRVETSSFAPEFGKSPGGQVILTTRSGTNELVGELYEYFRNDAMDANDWFANQAGNPRPAERHNDFGGIFGGPILRNRTFFFFSYEGARLRLPTTTVTDVPYLNNTSCTAPASVASFLNAYPKPNGPTSASSCTGQFTGSYSNGATLDATSLRVDHVLGERFSVFGRYNYAPSSTVSREYALNTLQHGPVNTQTLTLGLNMLLNRSTANTFRANYSSQSSKSVDSVDSFGGAAPIDPALILGPLAQSSSNASFETFDTDLYALGPVARNRTRQIDLVDDFSTEAGAHQLKFGVDSRVIYLDKNPYQNGIVFLAETVDDLLSTGTLTILGATTNLPSELLSRSTSLYAQDRWKLGSRLTLTYGLRWELAPAPSARDATKLAAWTNVSDPADIALAPFGTPLWSTTYGNVAPRFGIAWKPSTMDNLVVRGGMGVFYDLGAGSAADAATYFPGQTSLLTYGVSLPITNVASYLPAVSLEPPYPAVSAYAPNLKLPRSYEWNLAVEKSFGGHQIVSATYVGQAGRELLREAALYQPNPNFSSAFLFTGNTARSNYNALQLQYRLPILKGFQALANYTLSHSLDNSSNDVVAGLSGAVLQGGSDYSSSDFDVRQGFSGALTWQLPSPGNSGIAAAASRGWSLAGVTVVRTGFPFNGDVRSLSPITGGFALSRPDHLVGQPYWTHDPAAGGGKSLNPLAFTVPASMRQGTEGRNDIPGFDLVQVDLTAGRNFALTDRISLKFRADAFNVLNHPNFANPTALIGYGTTYLHSTQMLNNALGGLNPLFQEGGPRSIQLSLKLSF